MTDDAQQDPGQQEPEEQEPEERTLDGHDIETEQLDDWRIMFSALHARFKTGDFATGLDLVNQIGAAAEEMNHHPDLDLKYPHLDVRLTSHDVGGLSQRDVDLARRISDFAGKLGAKADPAAVQVLEIGLDTADHDKVKPFWAAVLGLDPEAGEPDEVVDGDGALTSIWFQESDAQGVARQRFHLDIRVPPEVAEARIKAALEAGGTLVSDARAPTFVVLADAEGNKVCVCTWLGRSG